MRASGGITPADGRWRALYALLLVFFYLGVGVFDHELWPPTEQAMAGVTWEMWSTGDLAVPRIDGMPYLEKPPLGYLLSWACCRIAGHMSAGLIRLPAALLGLGCLGLLYVTSRRIHGETVAPICTLLCATTPSFYVIMHRASSDAVALFFCFLCFAIFMRTLADHAAGALARPWRDDLLLAVALSLSFFVKNFYTFLIVAPPVAIFLVATRQLRRLCVFAAATAVSLLLMLIPWCLLLYRGGGSEYLRVVFYDNTVGRFFAIAGAGALPLSPLNDAFYVHKDASAVLALEGVGACVAPWILIQLGGLWGLFRRGRDGHRRLFLRILFLSILISVTISRSKTIQYYLPILFVVNLCAGDFLGSLFPDATANGAWRRRFLAMDLFLVGIVALALPLLVARFLRDGALAWLVAPNLAGIVLLVVHLRGRWHRGASAIRWASLVIGSLALTLFVAFPRVDRLRTWRPFFDEARAEIAGRRLFSTVCDDRKLPAMNFYFQRRLEVVLDPACAPEILASREKVAIVMRVDQYEQWRARLPLHLVLRASKGQDLLALVTNP